MTTTAAPIELTTIDDQYEEDRPPQGIERHGGDGRPKILPRPEDVEAAKATGTDVPKPSYYTRASGLGKVLESTFNLERWQQRMVLLGVLEDPSLMLRAAAFRDDRDKLNELAKDAQTLAKANSRREVGTALHKLTEIVDAGGDTSKVPAEYQADLAAYARCVEGMTFIGTEQFVVCDALTSAGTFDRLRIIPPKPRSKARPKARIVDLKTGERLDYSWLSIAVQLAIYANGERYDPATGARTPLGVLPDGTEVEIDTLVAEVIHLPAGSGRCELLEVDVAAGKTAAQLAKSVRGIRNDAKHWAKPAASGEASLADLVASAPTLEVLYALWTERGAEFDGTVGPLATARYELLSAGTVGATS